MKMSLRTKILLGITIVVSFAFVTYYIVLQKKTDELNYINELSKTKNLTQQDVVDLIGHKISYESLQSDNNYLRGQTYKDLLNQLRGSAIGSEFDFLSDPEMLIESLYSALKDENKDTSKSALGIVVLLSQMMGMYNLNLPDASNIDEKYIQLFTEYDKSQINALLYMMTEDESFQKIQRYAYFSLFHQNKTDAKAFALVDKVLSMPMGEEIKESALFSIALLVSMGSQRERKVELPPELLSTIYSNLDSELQRIRDSARKVLAYYQNPDAVSILLQGVLNNPSDDVLIRNITLLMRHDKKMVVSNPLVYKLDKVAVSDVARKKYISFVLWIEKK